MAGEWTGIHTDTRTWHELHRHSVAPSRRHVYGVVYLLYDGVAPARGFNLDDTELHPLRSPSRLVRSDRPRCSLTCPPSRLLLLRLLPGRAPGPGERSEVLGAVDRGLVYEPEGADPAFLVAARVLTECAPHYEPERRAKCSAAGIAPAPRTMLSSGPASTPPVPTPANTIH